MLSAVNRATDAVEAMKLGAFDYITKPFDMDEVTTVVARAVRMGATARENAQLRAAVSVSKPMTGLVGSSSAMQQLQQKIGKIAPLNSTVLIPGESGVGKSLLARVIHYGSPRADGPFVTVSCPALPRELLESELFGHEKGAFTGALQQRIGRIEMADKGTLFLDEIGDLPLALQPKLLTFLQDRCFQRVGGNRTIKVDVRVIAATNVDLAGMVKRQEFREDLYYRLNVIPVHIPPLRERREDLPELCAHILGRIAKGRGGGKISVSAEAKDVIHSFDWPGNIRQLENVLERASAFCEGGVICPNDLPDEVRGTRDIAAGAEQLQLAGLSLEQLEQLALTQTLAACGNNRAEAARRLGISEKTIYNKLQRLGVR
jgi:DNA-binding NtrC family response regulator